MGLVDAGLVGGGASCAEAADERARDVAKAARKVRIPSEEGNISSPTKGFGERVGELQNSRGMMNEDTQRVFSSRTN
jgi:hypothetical protein